MNGILKTLTKRDFYLLCGIVALAAFYVIFAVFGDFADEKIALQRTQNEQLNAQIAAFNTALLGAHITKERATQKSLTAQFDAQKSEANALAAVVGELKRAALPYSPLSLVSALAGAHSVLVHSFAPLENGDFAVEASGSFGEILAFLNELEGARALIEIKNFAVIVGENGDDFGWGSSGKNARASANNPRAVARPKTPQTTTYAQKLPNAQTTTQTSAQATNNFQTAHAAQTTPEKHPPQPLEIKFEFRMLQL